jgi:hypothetical protein
MKVKTYVAVSVLCLLGISPAFAFDVSDDGFTEMSRAIYGTVLADLMVGDKMRISKYYFCVSNGLLMISEATPFDAQDDYSPDYTAEILAGSEVAITISTEHMSSPTRSAARLDLYPCQDAIGTRNYPVKSVNGFETLDAYLKSDFVTKLPKP